MSMKTNPPTAPLSKSIYFTPAEAGNNTLEFLKHKASRAGMKWLTPKMNNAILPLDAGMMAAICSLPGAGKTTHGVALSAQYARELVEQSAQKSVLFISLDQPAENIRTLLLAAASRNYTVTDFHRGEVPEAEIQKLNLELVELPIYICGKSAVERRDQPRFTFQNIERGIREMEQHVHLSPALIVIDYIQIMPIERDTRRTEQVTEAVYQARELCLDLQVPILLLAQATRDSVKDRRIKIPLPQDSQHSSAIEQAVDCWIGLWKPQATEIDKTQIELFGQKIAITNDLVLAGLEKQWKGASGIIFQLQCNFGNLVIQDR